MSRSATEADRTRIEELVEAKLLLRSDIDGLYGRTAAFEAVVDGIQALVAAEAADHLPERRRFPPGLPSATLEATGYLRSFPDLLGAVTSFEGGERDHSRLLERAGGGEPWEEELRPTGMVLCAAACHPLYPTVGPRVPDGGAVFDVLGWVFRHEPSIDPARQQWFRMHEVVYVGDADAAVAFRDLWRDRAAALLRRLGVDVVVDVAHDPFFGRAGKLLASGQIEAALKYEVLGPTSHPSPATALVSSNCHRDHFGVSFGIASSDGATAHSACVGFGLERITLALLWAHGLDPGRWPGDVCKALRLPPPSR